MSECQWVILYDFDNIKADPHVINEVIRERGRIVLARAYGDAMRDQKFREIFLEENVEIIDRPRLNKADHRGNDIRIAIDAVEMALRHPNVTHFALITGDTDFVPLVNRLKLYGMYVTVIGSQGNTSPKIIQAADDFLGYEDLVREEVLISDDFQTNALALYRKAMSVIREQRGPANPARIQKMLGRIDANFRWRDGGFIEFSDFLTWVKGQQARDERATDEPGDLNGREIHAFNLLLRALDQLQELSPDASPSPDRVRAQIKDLDQSFDESQMGLDSFASFLGRMAETDKVTYGKTYVRLEPEFAWRRGLKKLQISAHPRLFDGFLKAFNEKTAEALEAEKPPSLGDIASRVKKVLRVSNQKVNELVRAVKFSGALETLDGERYVTYNIPYRMKVPAADLRRVVLKGYLRKLARVRAFKRSDLALFASMLLGDDCAENQALLLELAQEMSQEGVLRSTRVTFHHVRRDERPEVEES